MPTRFGRRDAAAALAVVFLWGLNFIPMKLALLHFTPFQLGAARYVFAVLPLLFIVRPPAVPARYVLAYGLFQGVGQFGFLFTGLQLGMTSALASVLMQTQVFSTALLGLALLGERPSGPLQIGLGLAALGLGCFAIDAVTGRGAVTTVGGLVYTLLAASMWAVSNIVSRRAQQVTGGYDPLAYVVWGSAVPIVPFLLLSIAFDAPAARTAWLAAPWSAWLAVAYLGWAASLAGYALWTGLLTRHPANRVAPFSLGIPLVGIAAGISVLGEVVTPWQWVGAALLLSALGAVLVGGAALGGRARKAG